MDAAGWVAHVPSVTSDRARREAERQATALAALGVEAVALVYVDIAGIWRVKTIPRARLEHATVRGVGMSPVFDAFLSNDEITSSSVSGGPMDDLRLVPDLDFVRLVEPMEGWAFAPVARYRRDGSPYPLCTRHLLARRVRALEELGVRATMGFEIEWVVSASDGDGFVPATQGPAYGLARVSDLAAYVRDLYRALERAGIEVLQIHPEYAPGQFELSTAPADPITAADVSVLARLLIRSVGLRHGLRTSFAPVVEVGGVGNGGHVHLGLEDQYGSLFAGGKGPGSVREEGASVVAWLLEELPGLLAIGAPHPVSYLRLVPSHWAGAYRVWGIENREAALRLVPSSQLVEEGSANLELKAVDLAANPYLLASALLGVVERALGELRTPPPPIEGDPASLPGAERLPADLATSLAALQASEVLKGALGEGFLEAIGAVREAELARFRDASPAEIVAAMRWSWS